MLLTQHRAHARTRQRRRRHLLTDSRQLWSDGASRCVDGAGLRRWSVMKGYYNMPEHTAATIDAEGWLHTGDLGSLDAEAIMAAVSERGDEYVTRCIDRAAEVAGGGGPSLSLLRRIIAEGVHETGVARQRATAGRAGSSAGVSDWGGATTTDGWGDG